MIATEEQRREWFTPFIKDWTRGSDDWLTGHSDGRQWMTGSPGAVSSASELEKVLNHLRRKTWFRRGDELTIRALYPEFNTEAVSE